MHITVHKRSSGRVHLELCKKCSLYHCPFCQPSVFKPRGDFSRVWTHIESHRLKALQHGEFTIFICHLECRGVKKHFHCPYCPKMFINRRDCKIHIGKCQAETKAGRLGHTSRLPLHPAVLPPPPPPPPPDPLVQVAAPSDQPQHVANESLISSELSVKSSDSLHSDCTSTSLPHLSERETRQAVCQQKKMEHSQPLDSKRAAALVEGDSSKKARTLHAGSHSLIDLYGWSEVEHDYCMSQVKQSGTLVSSPKAELSVIHKAGLPAQAASAPSSCSLAQSSGVDETARETKTQGASATICANRSCQTALKKANSLCRALQAELSKLREEMRRMSFSEEAFEDDNEKVRDLTGLPSFAKLMFVFAAVSTLMPVEKLKLSRFQNFIIMLMYLKLNLPFQFFTHMFLISKSSTSLILNKMLDLMHDKLSAFLKWPAREPSGADHSDYTNSRTVTVVIDCFEVPVETQTHPRHNRLTLVKYIIATTTEGVVSFVSTGWPGETKDTEIAKRCGLLENLSPGDVVIAGHKFDIRDSVNLRSAVLQRPAKVLSQAETVSRQLRDTYAFLQGPVHYSFCQTDGPEALARLDKIVRICCVLHNISKSDSLLSQEPLNINMDGSEAGK